MSGNPFDKFDAPQGGNPFDAYDVPVYGFADQPKESRLKTAIKEPFALLAETGTGFVNAAIRGAKGAQALAKIPIDVMARGKTLDESLNETTQILQQDSSIQSPLKSKVLEWVGEKAITPAVRKTADVTGLSPETLGTVLQAGGDIASLMGLGYGAGAPLKVAKGKVLRKIEPATDAASRGIMSHIYKQPLTMKRSARDANIKLALEEGRAPTVSHANKLDNDIAALEQQLQQGLNDGQVMGVKGSTQPAIDNINALRQQALHTSDPAGNVRLIDDAISDLSQHPLAKNGLIDIADLQAMKVTQGRELAKKYGEQGTFKDVVDKARVNGFKKELENALDTAFPELAGTNSKLSSYYQLKKSLDTAVKRNENSAMSALTRLGFQSGAASGLGFAAGGAETAAAMGTIGAVYGMLMHPAVGPLVARELYKVGKGSITKKQALDMAEERLGAIASDLVVSSNE